MLDWVLRVTGRERGGIRRVLVGEQELASLVLAKVGESFCEFFVVYRSDLNVCTGRELTNVDVKSAQNGADGGIGPNFVEIVPAHEHLVLRVLRSAGSPRHFNS